MASIFRKSDLVHRKTEKMKYLYIVLEKNLQPKNRRRCPQSGLLKRFKLQLFYDVNPLENNC